MNGFEFLFDDKAGAPGAIAVRESEVTVAQLIALGFIKRGEQPATGGAA